MNTKEKLPSVVKLYDVNIFIKYNYYKYIFNKY